MMKAAIFDLDGVLVDTARYHYKAWRELASRFGFDFTLQDNERLKGVSRMRSLEILMEIGGIQLTPEQMQDAAAWKNQRYVDSLMELTEDSLLPGARYALEYCRKRHIATALGSASKNAGIILQRTGIADLLDAIIDGNAVSRPKPDPQVFALGAEKLNVPPEECIVFEDALAGIEAAHHAGMKACAIGSIENLPGAEWYAGSLADVSFEELFDIDI